MKVIALSTLFLSAFQVMAQDEKGSIKYSEETLEEPKEKNLKWVPRRKGHYNMDNFQSMLKIGTTPLYGLFKTIGNQGSSFFVDIGYERKILKTWLSIEFRVRSSLQFGNVGYDFYRSTSDGNLISSFYLTNYTSVDLIGRYYLFKKRSIERGQSGDNLYGFYILGGALNLAAWQKERILVWDERIGFNTPHRETIKKGFASGPIALIAGAGYQQKFLKKGYIDLSTGFVRHAGKDGFELGKFYLDLTVGYSIFRIKP